MSFLRVLARDLVEKRLWPVAVFFAVAAVAVPVAVSASGSSESTPPPLPLAAPPAVPAGLPAPGRALNAVAGPQTPQQRAFRNYERNPFRAPYGPKTPAARNPAAAKSSAASPSPPSTAGRATTTKHSSPPALPKAGSTQPATFGPLDSYRVDVEVSDGTGKHTLTSLPRLSPLPSAADPLMLFLGVVKGGARAAFLFAHPIMAVGAFYGRCLPSKDACQIAELVPGEVFGLVLAGTPGATKPQISISPAITIQAHSSSASARKVRAMSAPLGRALVAKMDPAAVQILHYTVADGALTEQSPATK